MATIINPILPGFNPDPSIVRVGADYFIATSTFEWFPGVQIHHSKDLVHWRLLAHPLNRLSQLNLLGNPTSGGIWAPSLSYADGKFWLIYTDVKVHEGAFKDTHNYLVTAPDIIGPWSDPIYLNSSGFDPSLFHDEDGRKWLVNELHDFRKGRNRFAGIVLQEYSVQAERLVGPVTNIFKGTALGKTEGPHLYKRGGYYYLLTAEGGTGYEHAVTMARSRHLQGPYETDPANPVLTSTARPELALQKAGHGSLVETQAGEWYLVHLCGRPNPVGHGPAGEKQSQKPAALNLNPAGERRCNLGRETAIQKGFWTEEGWFRLENGKNTPEVEVPGPDLAEQPFPPESARDDFDENRLNVHFATLRTPPDESWLSLSQRPGYLRLRGRESLSSKHRQSLVARRLQHFRCEVSTCLEFEPQNFQQMAGLICFYDTQNYFYLRVTYNEAQGKCLGIITSDNGSYDEPLTEEVRLEGWGRYYLKALIDYASLQFFYSQDGKSWSKIGPEFDATLLSDEHCREGRFTGTMLGVGVQDMSGMGVAADFDYFEYLS